MFAATLAVGCALESYSKRPCFNLFTRSALLHRAFDADNRRVSYIPPFRPDEKEKPGLTFLPALLILTDDFLS
jgi:hypothetical protein